MTKDLIKYLISYYQDFVSHISFVEYNCSYFLHITKQRRPSL